MNTENDHNNAGEEMLNDRHEEAVDFEKYIEDALDDADMQEEKKEETTVQTTAATEATVPDPEQPGALQDTARELMDIISQNELIEKAKRERVEAILAQQERVREKRREILERLKQELALLNKRRDLARLALKKAKAAKLDDDRIALILHERNQARQARRHCKNLIAEEKKALKNIANIISLLETAR